MSFISGFQRQDPALLRWLQAIEAVPGRHETLQAALAAMARTEVVLGQVNNKRCNAATLSPCLARRIPMNDAGSFRTFEDFYPFYLGEHSNRACRRRSNTRGTA